MERLLAAHADGAEGDGRACMLKALCQVAQVSGGAKWDEMKYLEIGHRS